ncbi:MAG: hypothetical protein E7440_05655 [Ruminococcaceae bacterium]|nr:hypothetical protein [Oscillospiraceae bacterium]
MAKRRGYRRTVGRTAGCAVQEETGESTQVVEEMPMCRHVNSIGRDLGCSNIEWQLCRVSQLLDEQSRVLAELLQEVRGKG